jgi:hypothetical protein
MTVCGNPAISLYFDLGDPDGGNRNGSEIKFNVDNFGIAHEHPGSWISEDHFYMQANEIQNKKNFLKRST